MRVLLVAPPYFKPYAVGQYIADAAPIGMCYVASYARQQLNPVMKLIDYGVEEYSDVIWEQAVRDFKPDVVGFNTLTLGYAQVKKMSGIVRENSHAMLISGGAHSTIHPEEMLECCDAAVRGEGEMTFVDILKGLPFEDIPGISYKTHGHMMINKSRERINELDDLPFPAYDMLDAKKYAKWGLMGSRGCPFACEFCASPVLWNRIMRVRSPKSIADEMSWLYREYNVHHISFEDDTFNLSIERGTQLCDEIINRHLPMTFTAQMRANQECVSLKLFDSMKDAGCTEMKFGVESGSNKVLQSMNKNLTTKEVSRAVRLAKGAGINHVAGFFMVGNWDETIFDVMKTWWFIATNPIDTILTVCTPLPSTGFEKKLKDAGYIGEVDWRTVNWVTPLARTNKLSKGTIRILYYITVVFFHLPAHMMRGGNAKSLLRNIWSFVVNKVRK